MAIKVYSNHCEKLRLIIITGPFWIIHTNTLVNSTPLLHPFDTCFPVCDTCRIRIDTLQTYIDCIHRT